MAIVLFSSVTKTAHTVQSFPNSALQWRSLYLKLNESLLSRENNNTEMNYEPCADGVIDMAVWWFPMATFIWVNMLLQTVTDYIL